LQLITEGERGGAQREIAAYAWLDLLETSNMNRVVLGLGCCLGVKDKNVCGEQGAKDGCF